jgi:hypothetical protein
MDIRVEVKKVKGSFWDLRVDVDCGVGKKWTVAERFGSIGKGANAAIMREIGKMVEMVSGNMED